MDNNILPVVQESKESVIKWNYEPIKVQLTSFLEKYVGYVVSEDTLSDDKKTRAELNKVSKSIDDFRKTIKKDLLAPVDKFEDECKELVGMVKDVSSNIDDTVKEFELKKKEEKRAIANEILDEIKSHSEIPNEYLNRIEFKENFCNLSISKTQVREDIEQQLSLLDIEYKSHLEKVETIKSSVAESNKKLSVKLKEEDFVEKLKFKELSEIIVDISKRADEIFETENKVEEEKPVVIPVVEKPKKEEPIRTVTIEVTATDAQLVALKDFLKTNSISYNKLK